MNGTTTNHTANEADNVFVLRLYREGVPIEGSVFDRRYTYSGFASFKAPFLISSPHFPRLVLEVGVGGWVGGWVGPLLVSLLRRTNHTNHAQTLLYVPGVVTAAVTPPL